MAAPPPPRGDRPGTNAPRPAAMTKEFARADLGKCPARGRGRSMMRVATPGPEAQRALAQGARRPSPSSRLAAGHDHGA
jgi:hypothetical protein